MKKHLGVLIVETVQLQPTPVVSGNGKRHKIVSVMVKKKKKAKQLKGILYKFALHTSGTNHN